MYLFPASRTGDPSDVRREKGRTVSDPALSVHVYAHIDTINAIGTSSKIAGDISSDTSNVSA
jgi:hypothetical protein